MACHAGGCSEYEALQGEVPIECHLMVMHETAPIKTNFEQLRQALTHAGPAVTMNNEWCVACDRNGMVLAHAM